MVHLKNKPTKFNSDESNVMLTMLFSVFMYVQACAQNVLTQEPTQAGSRRERLAASTPEQRAERQTAQMKKQLALTADQETSVGAINLKYAKQVQALMTTGDRDRGTLKEARGIMENKDGELKAVLSKDQYKQYETLRDDQKDRIRQGRGPRINR